MKFSDIKFPYGIDKLYHLIAGLLIALVVSIFCGVGWGLFSGLWAGAVKEGLDYAINVWDASHDLPKTHDVDFKDFLATAIGACLGAAVALAFGLHRF